MKNLECTRCGSDKIIKDGKQKVKDVQGNALESIQRYRCTGCGKRFNKNRTANILNEKERFTNELINYLFKMDELDFKNQAQKSLSYNSKNLVKLLSKRLTKKMYKPSEQFKFIKIKHNPNSINGFNKKDPKVKGYLITEDITSEDDFVILIKKGNNLYFVNNEGIKGDCTEMTVGATNLILKFKKIYNTEKYNEEFDRMLNG